MTITPSPDYSSLITATESLWQRFGATPPIAGLHITRAVTPTSLQPICYQPSLCVVLRGKKRSALGALTLNYTAGQCLLASMHVPAHSRIIEASSERPYLAFRLAIEPHIVGELMASHASEQPHPCRSGQLLPAVRTANLFDAIVDPLKRLLQLPDTPQDLPVLQPLFMREIVWRLLNCELAAQLYDPSWQDSRMAQIGRVTAWLRQHYRQPIRVTELADMANMSAASFHRHFKAVTQVSPVQFQKNLRLQEARNLLIYEPEIAAIAYAVGYESPSQFSRDYRRLFGVSPREDRGALLSPEPTVTAII
ncbi:MAG TPA: AraC family transcriptional regulator [Gammaproteobacteria bacterium]|nr:AraC family transcriptional regulator [Gammaproteobacteria bacterium]